MRYVIAASTERAVAACQASLEAHGELEYRVGSVAQAGWDCDAAIVSFPLAHDRYGGTPEVGRAQILENNRQDGAPRIVLATPPISPSSASPAPTDEQIESHVAYVIGACVAVYAESRSADPSAKILIHLEAAGIDRKDLKPVAQGIERFLTENDRR
jgi:hypothetical protein